jgi:sialic acid synthase SpsE
MHTLVIAEIGSAWLWFCAGTLIDATSAIAIAKSCGADCIKFQWTSDPRKMEQRRNVPEGSYNILAWPKDMIPAIAEECRLRDIEFMCTVFLPEDVETLNPYVKRWKVASLECDDQGLIDAMIRMKRPILRSVGASNDDSDIYVPKECKIHCTAAYPAPLAQLNLSVIAHDGGFSGYSDHSRNVLTGALAVACGAKIVEVHFKLQDTPSDNPDYDHSLWPEQLRAYISNIRQAELMLGDGIKKIEASEQWALKHKVKA